MSLFALSMLCSSVWADDLSGGPRVAFDIPQQRADLALTEFAEQADLTLVFPSDVAREKLANPLVGEYTLEEGVRILLSGTGLNPAFSNRVVLSVAADDASVGEGDVMKTTKRAGLVAILTGVFSGGVDAQEPAPATQEVQTSVITGKVTDARTGANLKGARILIEETGRRTNTNDLGEFRFVSVPVGTTTLTVSYLGYAGQSVVVGVRGPTVAQDFALRGGSEVEEIVVFGQRSARAQALNLERTAENSTTVLSADLLGQFEGATLAETLRRVPGVAFQEDPLTGDGTNVIVRGLAPDFNQIRLDGQRLAEGTGLGRSPAIGNLLTDSIDEVTISKTLLPSQDSAGSGGLIDITTKGPLDRGDRFARLSIEGATNDGFQDSEQYSGLLSGRFGSNGNLGLSASIQYRRASDETVGYGRDLQITGGNGLGKYLPLSNGGQVIVNPASIPPTIGFPFLEGVDDVYPFTTDSFYTFSEVETLAGTLVAQWQPMPSTDLRLSYTKTDQTTDFSQRSVEFNASQRYVPLPIPELGGEVRGAFVWEDAAAEFGAPGLLANVSHDIGSGQIDEVTDVLSFQGETRLGSVDLNYRYSRSTGENTSTSQFWSYRLPGTVFGDVLTQVPESFLTDTALQNTINGQIVSAFAPVSGAGYQLPLFGDEGFAFFNSPQSYRVDSGIQEQTIPGENDRESIAFSARKNFSGFPLTYLEAGFEFESSRFDSFTGDVLQYIATRDNLSLSDLGINSFQGRNLSSIGIQDGFLTIAESDFAALLGRIDSLTTGDDPLFEATTQSTERFADESTFTDEEELALYLQGRVDIGNLEVVGGLRYSRVDVTARVLSSPTLSSDPDFATRFREVVDLEGSQSQVLPRVLLNYRPTDKVVVRAGYFQSVARPRIQDISRTTSVGLFLIPVFGPNANQPFLQVNKGNPDLEPSKTHNLDMSISFYDENAGVLQASVFYKDIENFLEFNTAEATDDLTGVVLPDAPEFQNLPNNVFIAVRQPFNSDDPATIWGLELSAEKQFVGLPGAFNGLGIFANYTYTESEKTTFFDNVFDPDTNEFVDISVPNVPFDQSPEHSGTLAFTYNKYPIDAIIAYSAQSRRLLQFRGNDLSRYNESDDTLDVRFEYQFTSFGSDWSLFLAGTDLLKGSKDPDTLEFVGGDGNAPELFTSGTFFGGRVVSAGLTITF